MSLRLGIARIRLANVGEVRRTLAAGIFREVGGGHPSRVVVGPLGRRKPRARFGELGAARRPADQLGAEMLRREPTTDFRGLRFDGVSEARHVLAQSTEDGVAAVASPARSRRPLAGLVHVTENELAPGRCGARELLVGLGDAVAVPEVLVAPEVAVELGAAIDR